MTEKYRIKKQKARLLPPRYVNLTLVMQGALLLKICYFLHIILEQKGLNAIATACKCRSKLLGSTQLLACRMAISTAYRYISVHCPQDVLVTICYVSGQTFSSLWYVNHYMLHIYVL